MKRELGYRKMTLARDGEQIGLGAGLIYGLADCSDGRKARVDVPNGLQQQVRDE